MKDSEILYLGKIPPQNIELEEAVLGSFLVDINRHDIINNLDPEYFYSNVNSIVFTAIKKLYKEKKPIDFLTVANELKKTNQLEEIGGQLYLTTLASKVGSSVHSEFHSFIIEQSYILRELISKNNSQINNCYANEKELDEIIEEQKKIYDHVVNIASKHAKTDTLFHSIEQLRDRIELRKERYNSGKMEGVPSFIKSLDKFTFGFQRGDLIIMGARPSVGKTSAALKFAKEEIDNDIPVAFFSLEMTKIGLFDRLVLSYTELNPDFYKSGNINAKEQGMIDTALDNLVEKPFYVDDTPSMTTAKINSIVRGLVNENRCSIVYIDYLGLIKPDSSNKNLNRNNQVGDISKQLKAIAKDNDVPVVVLCQLNREVEKRTDKRPKLADLRDSGEIEQDADLVILLHREGAFDTENNSNEMEFIIAKHRQGALGTATCKYTNDSLTVMYEDDNSDPQPVKVFNNQLPYATDF